MNEVRGNCAPRRKPMRKHALVAALCAGLMITGSSATVWAADDRPETTWQSIQGDIFNKTEFLNGENMMVLDAPYRAEDAAIVPISVKVQPGMKVKKVTVVIDENPAPMAAQFTFGPAAANASVSSRYRVNNYSWVRAIAETEDGKQYMVKKFVKASGGCSAPATKDADAAKALMGKMKFRVFKAGETKVLEQSSGVREAQIMIRHPNNSGLQMDQVTMLHIPAHFVDMIEVKRGDDLVLKVEGGISLSEDPNIRFYYNAAGKGDFTVNATDTDGQKFTHSWPAGDGQSG
jgi:sulfur-oxidizing protein SoxY